VPPRIFLCPRYALAVCATSGWGHLCPNDSRRESAMLQSLAAVTDAGFLAGLTTPTLAARSDVHCESVLATRKQKLP
jgi:hypothetical protein